MGQMRVSLPLGVQLFSVEPPAPVTLEFAVIEVAEAVAVHPRGAGGVIPRERTPEERRAPVAQWARSAWRRPWKRGRGDRQIGSLTD